MDKPAGDAAPVEVAAPLRLTRARLNNIEFDVEVSRLRGRRLVAWTCKLAGSETFQGTASAEPGSGPGAPANEIQTVFSNPAPMSKCRLAALRPHAAHRPLGAKTTLYVRHTSGGWDLGYDPKMEARGACNEGQI